MRIFFSFISLFFLALPVFSMEHIHQSRNGDLVYFSTNDEIIQVNLDGIGTISNMAVRETWKLNSIDMIAPFDTESFVILATRKKSPQKRLWIKASLGSKAVSISNESDYQNANSSDFIFGAIKAMTVVGEVLLMATEQGLFAKNLKNTAKTVHLLGEGYQEITAMITVGQRTVFHQTNGTLYALNVAQLITDGEFTATLALGNVAPYVLGTGWGNTSQLAPIGSQDFIVQSPQYETLKIKSAMKKANAFDAGEFVTGMLTKNNYRIFKDSEGRIFSIKLADEPEFATVPVTTSTNLLDIIVAHLDQRFQVLSSILRKDAKYRVLIPGSSAQVHALGVGYAKDAWNRIDGASHKKMVAHITALIQKLMIDFPNRVSFGMIGDYSLIRKTGQCDRNKVNPDGVPGQQLDGTFIIHVWGANEKNFNLPNDYQGTFGKGQASCFSHQRPGVFGVSTMPSSKRTKLMANDELLSLY